MVLRPHCVCKCRISYWMYFCHNVIEKFDSFTTRQQMFGCSMDHGVGNCVRVCALYYDRSRKNCQIPPKPAPSVPKMKTHTHTHKAAMRGIMFSCVQVPSLDGMRSQPQCCCGDIVTLVSCGPCQRNRHHLHSSAPSVMSFKSLPHSLFFSSPHLRQPAVIIILLTG